MPQADVPATRRASPSTASPDVVTVTTLKCCSPGTSSQWATRVMVPGRDDALRDHEAGGQLEVVARGAHGDRDGRRAARAVGHAHLHRLLRRRAGRGGARPSPARTASTGRRGAGALMTRSGRGRTDGHQRGGGPGGGARARARDRNRAGAGARGRRPHPGRRRARRSATCPRPTCRPWTGGPCGRRRRRACCARPARARRAARRSRGLEPGQAIAVSTGARIPEGADAVARREIVRVEGGEVRVEAAVAAGPRHPPPGRDDPRGRRPAGRRPPRGPPRGGRPGRGGARRRALRAAARGWRSSRPGPSWSRWGRRPTRPRSTTRAATGWPPRRWRPAGWWWPARRVGDDVERHRGGPRRPARRDRPAAAGRDRDQRGHLGGRPRPRAPGPRPAGRGGAGARRARGARVADLPRTARRPGRAGAAGQPRLGGGGVPPAGPAPAGGARRLEPARRRWPPARRRARGAPSSSAAPRAPTGSRRWPIRALTR